MTAELRSILARIDELRRQAEANWHLRTRRNADKLPVEIRLELFQEAERIDAELDALHNLT